ncbi:restriction endonuclease subunit S [Vibrio parahaemolyticus]|uniref:Restriction endonuclease subunit S n=1 Tax=Vibrio parahaemolyticus TaxID=670 RepID=A0A7Y0X946_VIBPH|nr:restriction endonuclease subunit S [Vibrio parahaemolyticus]EHC7287592.1 restriction endonuclease subunit S [Vibrio parahaemolyticus]EJE4146492.1 restriction endonuclease subunit S [Vibrio parahaemolyticus]ELU0548833.1 restriction endonuclease subunit S [Vibrio parahaemolyticus]MCZ5858310.1 restriction endonuclease subunit S [Vibrio parahaemolyticus]MCZ6277641.1 restriction endonuclease subunit S [Vibrio parahaemolyticus]
MVPNSWELTNFGQLAEFRNGLNFTKADQGETIKIVGVADFKDHSSLSSLDNLNTINVGNTVKDNDLIKSGDLLYVRSNGNKDLIGRCLFFPEVTEKLSFSGFTIRGRVTSKAILPNYLALLSRSEIVKQQFSKNGGGTNISNLSQQILNDVVVPLPTIEEQRKIAKTLSTWDKAIATTEKLIETSKQQKKALMQQLLTGKKRLVNPETGKAFEGEWEEVKLETVAGKIFGGGTPSRGVPEYWNGNIPWVTVKDLISTVIHGAKEHITEQGLSNSSANIVPEGTVIIATRMAVGKAVVATCDVAINQDLKAVSPSDSLNSIFLHYWFMWKSTVIEGMGTGSTVKGVQINSIKAMKVLLPNIFEQQKISSVLTATDKEIELLEAKLAHFKQEKKALMQQLLTGKRRVKVDEMEVA